LISEIWKTVSGYGTLYEVSNRGRVKSLAKIMEHNYKTRIVKKFYKERILNPSEAATGHQYIRLHNAKKGTQFLVHRLVCEAFNGPCPPGMECAHLDGDPKNNNFTNLIWCSHKTNCSHMKMHGTNPAGIRNPNAVLTEQDVLKIKERRKAGEKITPLALDFGVSVKTIYRIGKCRTWRHIL